MGSEAGPAPQARGPQAGFGVDFSSFWQGRTLSLATGLLLFAGGDLLFYSFGFLLPLRIRICDSTPEANTGWQRPREKQAFESRSRAWEAGVQPKVGLCPPPAYARSAGREGSPPPDHANSQTIVHKIVWEDVSQQPGPSLDTHLCISPSFLFPVS